jgi:hypothetical protein
LLNKVFLYTFENKTEVFRQLIPNTSLCTKLTLAQIKKITMKSRENSKLEIQTAQSGRIIIYSTPDYDDYGDYTGEFYTITYKA